MKTVGLLLLLLAMLSPAVQAAPTTHPIEEPIANAADTALVAKKKTFDDQAIPASAVRAAEKRAATDVSKGATPDNGFSVQRVLLSLAVVLAIIFGLRWIGRRFFAVPGGGGSTRAVQVLSRTTLAPRQHLLLIQVGRRVVLVANSGVQMNTLCEMQDPDEVADLMAQLREKTSVGAKFGSLFGKANQQFDDMPPDADDDDADLDEPLPPERTGGLSGLSDKVRKMARELSGKA